jgi:dimeric dUTPase (all-alpha-NTP-PPase superfamily)
MDRYHVVEQENLGRVLPDPHKIDLDAQEDQLRLKEYSWRVTEELAEATECVPCDGKLDELHFLEEMIDALHFSVELFIMSGLTVNDITTEPNRLTFLYELWEDSQVFPTASGGSRSFYNTIHIRTWETVEILGTTMNCLKNKPWKTTHMVTDKSEFRRLMAKFMHSLLRLMWVSGFNPKTLTQLYLNKNAVNQFRIGSNY